MWGELLKKRLDSYAEYLAAQGQIEPEPETLEVEDLPDAAGLRMLRLKVSSSAS